MRPQAPADAPPPFTMTDAPTVLPGVFDTVRDHARSAPDRPLGGIFLGTVDGDVITVERAVPTPEAEEHSGELVFTPACWDHAYAVLESAATDARIVGWFHSSPTHGAEMSAYDRSLHRTLFPDPTHVALAVDPGSEDLAWYGWRVERIAPLPARPEEPTSPGEAPDTGAQAFAVAASPSRRRRLAGGLLALVLLGAIAAGAFVWGHSTNRTRVVTDAAPTTPPASSSPGPTQQELEQARAEIQALRTDLAEQAARLAATQSALQKTKAELKAARKKPKPAQNFVLSYRVRPGDTLFTLAETFYGTGDAWEKIWHANPSPDPDVIKTGTNLKIPLQNPS